MTTSMLRGRFDAAREAAGVEKADFQMRDLRAKAGTDKAESSGDILASKRSARTHHGGDDRELHPQTDRQKGHAYKVNCGTVFEIAEQFRIRLTQKNRASP